MALRKCKECRKEVSSKAKTCPHCGAPVKQEMSSCASCLVSIIAVPALIALASSQGIKCDGGGGNGPFGGNPGNNQGVGREDEAWVFAQEFLTRRFKSPSTVSFGGLFSSQNSMKNVKSLGNNKYQVFGWVDAQNAFGGTVRSDFEIVLEYKPGENGWVIAEGPVIVER